MDAAGVLCNIDIQPPVGSVLDRPVAPNRVRKSPDTERRAGDVEVNLLLFTIPDDAAADDHADGAKVSPATGGFE